VSRARRSCSIDSRATGYYHASMGMLLFVAIIVFGCQARAQAPAADTDSKTTKLAGNSQSGKQLFSKYGCYECHGHQAEGTSAVGPRLAPNPIPLPVFIKYIRKPSGEMPPYTAKVISDVELGDIYTFLQSLPKPPDANSIPALK
jgi:mono/diheme cytochrome c family protein